MSPVLGAAFRRSWKAAAISSTVAVTLVTVAYQLPATSQVDFSNRLASALSVRGFYDAEAGYRWSRARSEIVFRDPGGSNDARLELVLSGFRPRGEPPPLLVVETPSETFRLSLSRRIAPYQLDVKTSGAVSSDFTVVLRSEVFSPGGGDDRALGVRVHAARLTTGTWSVPPAKQLVSTALIALLLGFPRRRRRVSLGASALVSLGFVFLRHWTALLLPVAAAGLALLAATEALLPTTFRFLGDWVRGMGTAARGALPSVRNLLLITLSATFLGSVAYVARTSFTLDLGSGEADSIAHRFGGFDSDAEGVRFREAFAGAGLDLRDFGRGSRWVVQVRAALSGPTSTRDGVLVRIDGREFRAELEDAWGTTSFEVPAGRTSWRSGHRISFPGYGGDTRLRIASLRIDRGRALPSGRAIFLLAATGLCVLLALGASGLSPSAALGGAFTFELVACALLWVHPVVVTPFLPVVVLGGLVTALFAVVTRGFLGALTERALAPELHPFVLGVGVVAFAAWFLASASPLYSGGHFGYHTAIAEEIWQGKFFLYYLPEPENMLARQPQWDNRVVPHSSLFHTLSSPLAALPRGGFYLGIKLFLAFLLATMCLSASLVATCLRGRRAGLFAALTVALLPTGYQLLGLGHLMTLFGCAAAAVALGFLVLHAQRLSERTLFWVSAGLLTFCFLSYTGSLLFTSVALLCVTVLGWRSDPRFSRLIGKLILLGWCFALLLYYLHWVVPFVRDTLPALVAGGRGGGDDATDFVARIAAVPRKFDYSFGSFLIPVAGVVGIWSTERGTREERLLVGWAWVLVSFSVLDLAFNFLLKHHYFAFPLVATGVAILLDRLAGRGRLGALAVAAIILVLAILGGSEALAVARGYS